MCSKRPSSISFRGVVGRCIRLSSPTTCSIVTRGSCYRRHIRFSPTAYRPRTGHFQSSTSSPCGLPHPEQGCQRLSFVVDDVSPSWPSRHPNIGMSSRLQHSASSIAFLSRIGASTKGFAFGSLHSLVRQHTSVWLQSPMFWQGSPDSSKQRLKGFCSTAGAVLPPPQWSNRGSLSIGPGTRLFQSIFSCVKEGWRSTTYSRPASSEPLPTSSRCWRWRLLCHRFDWETGLSLSTWKMPIFIFRSFGGTGSSFGSLLEGRLTNVSRSNPVIMNGL